MTDDEVKKLCGYRPNPQATARYVRGLPFQSIARDLPFLLRQKTERDVFLWLALMSVEPNYQRGKQLIGDCVSWGGELVCTMLLAMQAVKGETTWDAEVNTEAIYGLRAELGDPSWEDGWWGSGQAEGLQKFGVCLKKDYSSVTGNKEHDLRKYSGDRAKQWGYYGCGGQNDNGKLDAIAKEFPAKGVVPVKTIAEAAAAIDAGCPISICSDVGFGDMQRNSDGVVRRSGSWGHCMMLGGIRYKASDPQFRIFQSWGPDVASGPDPGIDHSAISGCSWWATSGDIEDILQQEDSYAFARVEGFIQPAWDWDHGVLV